MGKSGPGHKGQALFWCSTEDHAEDWFVVARDAHQARRFFAGELGRPLGEVCADMVVALELAHTADAPTWPTIELIAAVGDAFRRGDVAPGHVWTEPNRPASSRFRGQA